MIWGNKVVSALQANVISGPNSTSGLTTVMVTVSDSALAIQLPDILAT